MDEFAAKRQALLESGVRMMDPGAVYVEAGVTVGAGTLLLPGTILRGNTVVGENCEIGPNTMLTDCTVGDGAVINSSQCNESTIESGAHVGPFAYIRPNCHVGRNVKVGDFVELKNSTIGDGTKIAHLTYVGDADVGHRVNFGCGTVLVNYHGNRRYPAFHRLQYQPGLPGPCGRRGLHRRRLHHHGGCTRRRPGNRPGPSGGKAGLGGRPPGQKAAEVNPSPLRRAVGPKCCEDRRKR